MLSSGSFDFLIDYAYPLSRVNEYKVIDALYAKNKPMPENIDDWLDAPNESIIILGLKIMMFYNYPGAQQKIIGLLDHENQRIRENSIHAIRDLFITDAEKSLHDRFKKEIKILKLEIIESLAVIGSEHSILFIEQLLIANQLDPDLKLALLKCINVLDQEFGKSEMIIDVDFDKMKLHLNSMYI